MATRFVYKTIDVAPFIQQMPVEFEWYGGFSLAQKRRCIASLHRAYASNHPGDRLLEISSKSPDGFGVSLSAFNLTLELGSKVVPVECAFQGSKVFEEGGPYEDLLEVSPKDAKRDPRLRESGMLVAFELAGERYPLEPKDAFYNWLWISALCQHEDLARGALAYDAFTDIEFNPQRSINCQAIAAALYVSLARAVKLEEALRGFRSFRKIGYGVSR